MHTHMQMNMNTHTRPHARTYVHKHAHAHAQTHFYQFNYQSHSSEWLNSTPLLKCIKSQDKVTVPLFTVGITKLS